MSKLKKKTIYKIIQENNIETFNSQINLSLATGYRLVGGVSVFVSPRHQNEIQYVQAVTIEITDEDNKINK